jgi:hypothetical protein
MEQALESIAGWDVFEGADAHDGYGDAATATCPNCGFTGTMDPPVGIMPTAKKVDPSMAAAEFYDSYQDLRDALCQAVSAMVKYAYIIDFGNDWVVYTDDSETYYQSNYTVGPSGTISLNSKTEVHRVFVPVA